MGYLWYKNGTELLTEISESRLPEDLVALWYIGQMGMVMKWGQTVIYMDPVLGDLKGEDGKTRRNYLPPFSGKEAKADYIFCSHDHLDHIHPETIKDMAMANPNLKVAVPAPLSDRIRSLGVEPERILSLTDGKEYDLDGQIRVRGVATAHETYETDENGCSKTMGYVFTCGNIRLFHAGDTVVTEELVEAIQKEPVNVLMIPINGADLERHKRNIIGNMNSRDAAYFAKAVNADMTIPLHYDMVMGNEENPFMFANYMEQYYPEKKYHIMRLGEKIIYG